ncbi:MAG: nickel pincer cofactor biosynthesis protein LarB [Desulfobacteraceae bacterium]|jgi:NCAIR mutase (PurE)-related protein|nr:nickel pincer cofactor biosynthesis protein LarB [Desulfobacteraceae bacterium]
MNKELLQQILSEVAGGRRSVEEAMRDLTHLPFENIGYAHIDHHRSIRKGFPEVLFGENKTAEQILGIMERMVGQENTVLVTRVDPDKADHLVSRMPGLVYDPEARMLVWRKREIPVCGRGTILVVTAGTSDIPVAAEARLTAEVMGNRVETIFDVGVAGIHRLMAHRERIDSAAVLVVAAGMEGALPSVVAGMTSRPVIAVPTSIGYGANFGGLTALLAMLNSCSSNVAVVNIDNGFGAGYMAAIINRE